MIKRIFDLAMSHLVFNSALAGMLTAVLIPWKGGPLEPMVPAEPGDIIAPMALLGIGALFGALVLQLIFIKMIELFRASCGTTITSDSMVRLRTGRHRNKIVGIKEIWHDGLMCKVDLENQNPKKIENVFFMYQLEPVRKPT